MKKDFLRYKFGLVLAIGFFVYFFGISTVRGAGDCTPFYANLDGCNSSCRSCRNECAFCMAEPGQDCTDDCDCDDACDCERFLNAFCSCIQDGGVSSFGGESLCGNSNSNGDEGTEGENGDGDEGEGDDNCDDWGENYYYDPNIQTCIQCEKPLINDSCESYGGSWILNDLGTCCKEGGSCQHPTDENGLCGDGMVVDPNLAGCCMACNNPPQSGECQQGFVLQNNCCLNAGNCQSGYYDTNTQCIQCTGDTMPNEAHTRCICNPDKKCCGVQLNMELPFIGDCIEMNTNSSNPGTTSVSSVTAFPILMQGLMKIVMSIILIFSFLMIIVAGLMMTAGAFKSSSYDKGKNILKNVIISLILLGSSGLILSLINPSFFGG